MYYPSAAKQSVYSTVPADWASKLVEVLVLKPLHNNDNIYIIQYIAYLRLVAAEKEELFHESEIKGMFECPILMSIKW